MSQLKRALFVCAAGLLLLGGVGASAQATPQEAQELKTTLTPLGGEKAGNKDGTIPAWTGGMTTVPAGYWHGNGLRGDPFAQVYRAFLLAARDGPR